jgi:hypothetical protein
MFLLSGNTMRPCYRSFQAGRIDLGALAPCQGLPVILLALTASLLPAQSLEVYSEFQRVDPFGRIVAADRAETPREILSPAVARNGFASFHVAVSVPPQTNYLLYVVTNPMNACRVALYREHFAKTKDGWVPDPLSEVRRLPDFGAVPDPDEQISGQNTRVYLLDIWIPPDAVAGRFRLEVQLKVGYFLVKPLEIRVLDARIPDRAAALKRVGSLPGIEEPADASAAAPLAQYLAGDLAAGDLVAGDPARPDGPPVTVRGIIRRNAVQDMALARLLDRNQAGPDKMKARWSTLAGSRPLGAERYLRIRDFVYQESAQGPQ